MVHQRNRKTFRKRKLIYKFKREIRNFVWNNVYVDRQLGEVVCLVDRDEVLSNLREKYGNEMLPKNQ